MSVVITIKEMLYGRWGIYRGPDLLISQPNVAGAITDARELALTVQVQSGATVTVAFATPDTSIVLAHFAKPTASSKSSVA